MTGRAYCDVYMTLITATRGVVQVAMKEGGGGCAAGRSMGTACYRVSIHDQTALTASGLKPQMCV